MLVSCSLGNMKGPQKVVLLGTAAEERFPFAPTVVLWFAEGGASSVVGDGGDFSSAREGRLFRLCGG